MINAHIGTSPDLIECIVKRTIEADTIEKILEGIITNRCDTTAVVCEFKTFSGESSLRHASLIKAEYGRHIEVNLEMTTDHKIDNRSLTLFKTVIPELRYEYQIMHHIAVYKIPVLCLAATVANIEYIVNVTVDEMFGSSLSSMLKEALGSMFPWDSPTSIPIPPTKAKYTDMGRINKQNNPISI